MIEVWKRKENEIAHLWNMTNYKGNDAEIPDYRAEYIIDAKARNIKKENITSTYLRRVIGEIPSVLISIAIVVLCFWGYYKFSTDYGANASYSVGSSVVNAIVIIILGIIYRALAKVLVNWENHQYQEDWENSLVSKHFAF